MGCSLFFRLIVGSSPSSSSSRSSSTSFSGSHAAELTCRSATSKHSPWTPSRFPSHRIPSSSLLRSRRSTLSCGVTAHPLFRNGAQLRYASTCTLERPHKQWLAQHIAFCTHTTNGNARGRSEKMVDLACMPHAGFCCGEAAVAVRVSGRVVFTCAFGLYRCFPSAGFSGLADL
jgi:hypothetical protein